MTRNPCLIFLQRRKRMIPLYYKYIRIETYESYYIIRIKE